MASRISFGKREIAGFNEWLISSDTLSVWVDKLFAGDGNPFAGDGKPFAGDGKLFLAGGSAVSLPLVCFPSSTRR